MQYQKFNIVYRNYGIADRFQDGTIELNRALDKYPQLKKSIIKHELRHTDNPNFNKKDFIHDLSTPDQIKTWDMLKFMAHNPSSLIQFLPLYWTKKRGWIMDINLVVIYSILLAIVIPISIWAFLL